MILNPLRRFFKFFFIIALLLTCVNPQVSRDSKFFVSLTFDDGPYTHSTEQILEILKKYNIKATFFVVGKHAEKHPEIVNKIYLDGHTIGLHGYNHIDYTKLSKKQILSELRKAKKVVEDIIGKGKVKYFRPPAGKANELVYQCCLEENLKLVLWTFYPLDYGEKDRNKLLARIKTHKFDKYEIMLLHNGVPVTISVLEEIVKFITSRGGKFITLDQYFSIVRE